jgi:hypothetical protein
MPDSKWLSLSLAAVLGVGVFAQQPKTFKARLSPVPIDISMQANVAGSGSVSAVLTGNKLALTGTYEGLRGPATIAQVHKGPNKGIRGPVVFDLAVVKGTDPTAGTLNGSIDLTPMQLADLEKGRLYVQLHSEKAPEGNLWGWILPVENRR